MASPDLGQDSVEVVLQTIEGLETPPEVGVVQQQVAKEITVVIPDYPTDRSNDTANW